MTEQEVYISYRKMADKMEQLEEVEDIFIYGQRMCDEWKERMLKKVSGDYLSQMVDAYHSSLLYIMLLAIGMDVDPEDKYDA